MKFYTFPASPNCRKVDAVIKHLGIKDVEVVITDISKGASRTPEYLAINPMGRVPALEDGDLKLWESNAICLYLCERQGENGLWPKDAAVRGDVARWLFWESSHLIKAVSVFMYENLIKRLFGMGDPDTAKLQAGAEEFHALAVTLDKRLEGRSFLAGDALTLADFVVGADFTYAVPAQMPIDNYANIKAWYARLGEVDAWKETAPKMG